MVFRIELWTGCSSMSERDLDNTDIEKPAVEVQNPDFGTDAGMEPIVDRPE